jgi:DNA primase
MSHRLSPKRRGAAALPRILPGTKESAPWRTSKGARHFHIQVSHPDKVFWPEEGYTKADLVVLRKDFPETPILVLQFAQTLVARVASSHPDELTVELSISARGNRAYLDPFRNGSVQTVVAPYSVRRRPRAPVSTPLSWSEVKPSLDPASFNMENLFDRTRRTDPWADFFRSRQSLRAATERLRKL